MCGSSDRVPGICSIEGCTRPRWARGWCSTHYRRWRIHGDVSVRLRPANGEALAFYHETVVPFREDKCLIWPFADNGHGYGRLCVNGRLELVSRLICTEEHGPPPSDAHEAAHSCGAGDRGCVARAHVRWATSAENHADKVGHDTHRRGERQWQAKLTADDVVTIRQAKGCISQTELAHRFGVSQSQISGIQSGKEWAWLK